MTLRFSNVLYLCFICIHVSKLKYVVIGVSEEQHAQIKKVAKSEGKSIKKLVWELLSEKYQLGDLGDFKEGDKKEEGGENEDDKTEEEVEQ